MTRYLLTIIISMFISISTSYLYLFLYLYLSLYPHLYLYRFRYLQVPPGDLFVNSTLSTPADPDLTTWQRGEAKLYYVTTT